MTVGEKIKFYREARNPKLDALSKIATALGVNLNTVLDIVLKTPSDCAPYLLQMWNSLVVKFVGKKKDGYNTEDIAIQFESDFMQSFLCRWAEYIETINDLREKAKEKSSGPSANSSSGSSFILPIDYHNYSYNQYSKSTTKSHHNKRTSIAYAYLPVKIISINPAYIIVHCDYSLFLIYTSYIFPRRIYTFFSH